ncbi:uncharacterized protein LOC115235862 [Formica exsecta]|uniref:uncharacterized protein LOC115235862 n=1 Tax=Formica exsecta TaxID=72781 RepID=UPI00114136BF|nr:uncharacterized protein LOC115235862 [Formica exsecta]
MSRYCITVQVLNAQDYNMRLTVVFLIVTILVCAMIQESVSEQTSWFSRRRLHGCRRHRTTMAATTATTTTTTTSTTSSTPAGRRKREIIAGPLLSALA